MLKEKAKNANKTLAQVVRELLKLGAEKEKEDQSSKKKDKKKMSAGEFLLSLAEEAERRGFEGPPDMSVTIDETLYGLKKKKSG